MLSKINYFHHLDFRKEMPQILFKEFALITIYLYNFKKGGNKDDNIEKRRYSTLF